MYDSSSFLPSTLQAGPTGFDTGIVLRCCLFNSLSSNGTHNLQDDLWRVKSCDAVPANFGTGTPLDFRTLPVSQTLRLRVTFGFGVQCPVSTICTLCQKSMQSRSQGSMNDLHSTSFEMTKTNPASSLNHVADLGIYYLGFLLATFSP